MDSLKRSRSATPSTTIESTSTPKKARNILSRFWPFSYSNNIGAAESSTSVVRPSSASSIYSQSGRSATSIPLSEDTDIDNLRADDYGGSSNPIHVDEEYEGQQGPSYLTDLRPLAGPSRARRPNLDGQILQYDYSGLTSDRPSDTPIQTSALRASDTRRRIMERTRFKQRGGGRRAERGLQQARQAEADVRAAGNSVSEYFKKLRGISRPQTRTVSALAEYKQPSDIVEIFDRFQLAEQEAAAAAEAELRPTVRIPTSLSQEEQAIVQKTLSNPSFKKTIGGKAEVNASSIRRLRDAQWLDDEIMNAYVALLQMRSDAADSKHPKVHVFNSFFYGKMAKDGYNRMLARWTKKFNIFEKEIIIFPINLNNMHWVAAAVYLKEKRVDYFDSMGTHGPDKDRVFQIVLDYLRAEWADKKQGGKFDDAGWTLRVDEAAPQQNNGSDCGVFSCQTLEAAARGVDVGGGNWEFGQEQMKFMRQMMVWEIAQGELYPRW